MTKNVENPIIRYSLFRKCDSKWKRKGSDGGDIPRFTTQFQMYFFSFIIFSLVTFSIDFGHEMILTALSNIYSAIESHTREEWEYLLQIDKTWNHKNH